MNPAYISAFAGLAGAIIGGLASFATTWFTQREQLRNSNRQAQRAKLEALYNEFINESVRHFGAALTRQAENPANLVTLFALLSRMRLVATPAVVDAAVQIVDHILETFLEPNRSFDEIRNLVRHGSIKGLLAQFGDACRIDLDSRAG